MKEDVKFRSPRHKKAYLLRQDKQMSYLDIGKKMGCTSQNASLLVKRALTEKKPPGRPRTGLRTPTKAFSVYMRKEVRAAIKRTARKNKATLSYTIESRLVRTLVEDGLLPAHFLESAK